MIDITTASSRKVKEEPVMEAASHAEIPRTTLLAGFLLQAEQEDMPVRTISMIIWRLCITTTINTARKKDAVTTNITTTVQRSGRKRKERMTMVTLVRSSECSSAVVGSERASLLYLGQIANADIVEVEEAEAEAMELMAEAGEADSETVVMEVVEEMAEGAVTEEVETEARTQFITSGTGCQVTIQIHPVEQNSN